MKHQTNGLLSVLNSRFLFFQHSHFVNASKIAGQSTRHRYGLNRMCSGAVVVCSSWTQNYTRRNAMIRKVSSAHRADTTDMGGPNLFDEKKFLW